jgi:PAS domain S-box-containing protein
VSEPSQSYPELTRMPSELDAIPAPATGVHKRVRAQFVASAIEIWLGFGLAIVTLLMVGAVSYWSTREFAATTGWVTHTYAVIENLRDLQTASTSAENQGWAYILDNDPACLIKREHGVARVASDLAALKPLLADNPEQVRRLDDLAPLLHRRIAMNGEAIAQARNHGQAAGVAYVLANGWAALGDEISARINEMTRSERELLAERSSREQATAGFSIRIIIYGSLAALLFISFAAVFIERVLGRLRMTTAMAEQSAHQAELRGLELARQIAAARRAETRFANLVESATDAILTVNLRGEITYANRRTAQYFGYEIDELVGHSVDLLVPVSGRSSHAENRARYAREPKVRAMAPNLDLRAVRKGGTEFPVEVSLSPIEGDEGPLVLTTIRDMTEYKRAQEYRAMLSAIVETASYSILTLTPDLVAQTWNSGSETVYGYKAEEMIGRRIDVLTAPGRSDGAYLHSLALRGGAGLQEFETQALRKDGAIIDVAVSMAPIRGQAGDLRAISAISYDITERKHAEADLRARTEELARSNAELEQFAYVASHDLQEPLRMVASYLQLIAQRYAGRLDSDADEFINFAVDGATRMKQLINDLLNYSRAGRRVELGPVDLDTALDRALESLSLAIEETGARITRDRLPCVIGDANPLYEVFQNLIGNAIKFRGAEPPQIHIGAHREGAQWTISIADNGLGIAPEYQTRIFAMFQRLHGRDEYPGTGIGLAICKRIIERLGGRIWVDSQAAHGATFRFTLAAAEVDHESESASELRSSGHSAG